MHIRPERPTDVDDIATLLVDAFPTPDEANLVERLRESTAYVEELALVGVEDETVIGHVLFSTLEIPGTDDPEMHLTLAPVAVRPAHQGEGSGSRLIRHGLDRARELGYGSVLLHGSPAFYPRFGFVAASTFGLDNPFALPDEDFMALELRPDALAGARGDVSYPEPFEEC